LLQGLNVKPIGHFLDGWRDLGYYCGRDENGAKDCWKESELTDVSKGNQRAGI
jgi:hypothetical protein